MEMTVCKKPTHNITCQTFRLWEEMKPRMIDGRGGGCYASEWCKPDWEMRGEWGWEEGDCVYRMKEKDTLRWRMITMRKDEGYIEWTGDIR